MSGQDNPIGRLQEMAQLGRVAPPQYVLQEAAGESHCPTFSILATWEHGGRGWSALGVASSKKEAKRLAARRLLDQMFPPGDSGGGDPGDQPVTSGDTAPLTADQAGGGGEEAVHYPGNQVGALQEYSLSRGLGDPVYTAGEARGPPHRRVFTITCQVAEVKSTREGSTKKEAKHQAAGSVLEALRTAGEEAHEKAVDGVGDSLKSLDL